MGSDEEMSGRNVKAFRPKRAEDWESLDVNADNRLPASHRFLFLINSLLLSAAPVYLFSQIFDMAIPENAIVFGGVSVVSAVMLTMACQIRSKGLVAKLINKRGIELTSSIQLKVKGAQDDKAKAKLKAAEKERSEVDNEALALSLSTTNAIFLLAVVVIPFFVLRNTTPTVNYIGSTVSSGIVVLYLATRSK